MCVSVREDISRTTRAIFANFCAWCLWPWLLLQQGDEIPRERGNFGVFFPTDNALYSIAFGTPTKTVESIEMPFGMMSGLDPRNMLRKGDDPRGKGNFGGKHVPDKSNTPNICELNCFMQRHTTGTDAWAFQVFRGKIPPPPKNQGNNVYKSNNDSGHPNKGMHHKSVLRILRGIVTDVTALSVFGTRVNCAENC